MSLFSYVMADKSSSVSVALNKIVSDIVTSPLNLALLGLCLVLLYRIYVKRKASVLVVPMEPEIIRLKKQDMTLEQLKVYDGTGTDKRVCVAVNGKVFDVTTGTRFYGPGGPYSEFAGHDVSRALATFSVDAVKDEYDDLSDLNTMQMDSVKEWEMQFTEKYDYVGRLLKPGEEPNEYSDEEDQSQASDQKSAEGNKANDDASSSSDKIKDN